MLSGAAVERVIRTLRWAAITTTVLGAMRLATGVLSKCRVYYMLGHSACPVSDHAAPTTGR